MNKGLAAIVLGICACSPASAITLDADGTHQVGVNLVWTGGQTATGTPGPVINLANAPSSATSNGAFTSNPRGYNLTTAFHIEAVNATSTVTTLIGASKLLSYTNTTNRDRTVQATLSYRFNLNSLNITYAPGDPHPQNAPNLYNYGDVTLTAKYADGSIAGSQSFRLTQYPSTDRDYFLGLSVAPGQTVDFELSATVSQVGFISLVPEPASWALMVKGVGLVGAAGRRRRTATVPAY